MKQSKVSKKDEAEFSAFLKPRHREDRLGSAKPFTTVRFRPWRQGVFTFSKSSFINLNVSLRTAAALLHFHSKQYHQSKSCSLHYKHPSPTLLKHYHYLFLPSHSKVF